MSDPDTSTPAPPPTNAPAATSPAGRQRWGVAPPLPWAKPFDLATGLTVFVMDKVTKATSHGKGQYVFSFRPRTSAAGVSPPTYGNPARFSTNEEGGTIGDQIVRDGLPPTGRSYKLVKEDSKGSPSGYSIHMEEIEATA
jgi:hypothetical protein